MHRRIRPFVSRSLLAGGLLLISAAHAHDTRPPNFCPVNGSEMVVSHFNLTPQQLVAYRDAHVAAGETSPMECPDKSCGIVDDWYWAASMAMEQCAPAQRSLTAQGAPAPRIEVPASFNAPAPYHHKLYHLNEGLSGVCVVCATPESSSTSKY